MSNQEPESAGGSPPKGEMVSALRPPRSALEWALLLVPLGYLWFRLINNLRVEWETNPQYSYGYIVPLLCAGLLLRGWEGKGKVESSLGQAEIEKIESRNGSPRLVSVFCFLLFVLLAFFYLPTRLIEVATPEWRPIQWALGFITIGLTLVTIELGWWRDRLKQLAFPVAFLLVAIPWPTLIEQPVIQWLTRFNAAMVIEVMGILGVPAVMHGNVIEVGTGVVGIDEACSGIRSFQSSLMISLFFGELYGLSRWRRVLFLPIGFILAMAFNVGRTSFLTWVAARQGTEAIAKYHDPAGFLILVGCTAGMWVLGMLLKSNKHKAETTAEKAEIEKTEIRNQTTDHGPRITLNFQPSTINRLCLGLLLWLTLVEVGVQAWYRTREARLTKGPNWSVVFPTDNPTLRYLPIAPATFNLLRFDDGKQAAWTETDGTQWTAFYFNWRPGRVAGYLAKRHTPEICLPATGREMTSGPELMVLDIQGLQLPVRRYLFGTPGNSLHVYHCRWESVAKRETFVAQESARYNLVRGVWAGRGNQGQKIVEIIISGTDDPEQAKAAMVRQLEKMIKIEGESAGERRLTTK